MQVLKGFWQFLNTDVQKIPWGELAEKGIEAVTATNDLGEAWEEQAPHIKALTPYLQQVEPFLTTLDSPVTQLAISGLPFVSIGIGLLRLYIGLSKTEPTTESSVVIAAQLAYLQSLEAVLNNINDETLKAKLNQVSLKALVKKQLARLDTLELSPTELKAVTSRFRESVLATQLGDALAEQLKQASLDETETRRLKEQVIWGTHRYLHQAIAEAGESVEPLAEIYRTGGQPIQDRYDSIATYLNEVITPLPQEQIFDEHDPLIRFQDIYVQLDVQPLTQAGEEQPKASSVNSHFWAQRLLEQPEDEPRKVMFVEGEAGRGKSVFCRMLADWVRREMPFSYIPLLIRLRHIRTLANNLTETLEDCPDLEQVKFVRGDSDWLADRNTRFLIILDGFDELLLEGRATGGLKEFLQQVADFQARSHHQCLVTGRPLALQGVDRLITQTKNLERVRLEPLSDSLREQWLENWQALFEEAEVTRFRDFIQACPDEIADKLAREPLLIYLLARLHREGRLTREMFADKRNQQIQAKLRVYRQSVNWVLEKQRQDQNLRLAGLDDLEDLREVLREAALCVVQSGNETARLTMLKGRFQDTANPVAKFLKQSQQTTGQSDDKVLNNLLTTFYLKPGEGDKRGSVEFAHKSFGEYLFAERLKAAFEAWTEMDRRGKRLILDDRTVNEQIYDLLGYSGLSVEIVEYLFELLQESDLDRVRLFERLHGFYQRWCEEDFLNQPPTENLPQKKMLQLAAQEVPIGLKPVDVFAGLNVLIMLLKLHAAAQLDSYPHLPADAPRPDIWFHPCSEPETKTFNPDQLLSIIHYTDSLEMGTFTRLVGPHLYRANLYRANLYSANLTSANLTSANLTSANLYRANLDSANLTRANLSKADLDSANLTRANLTRAELSKAKLSSTNLDSANLTKANLTKANLTSAYLYRANLTKANLTSANLTRANLYSANLTSAYLTSAYLYTAYLYTANLDSADLTSTNLVSANLISAYLHSANLTSADLTSANLTSADLDSANLTSANLDSADLTSANLTSVIMSNAILLGTDLRGVNNLNRQTLEGNAPPLICNVALPSDIEVHRSRDCDRLPAVLRERYPERFKTLEAAESFVDGQKQ
ncbi:MAG: pentapeptide repeat-containing protein [Leptolyngbya sp. SIO1E4]|nr:pentapeptide repeat-containing protein [Leptolyngbya sp. SIO1E4]